MMRALLLIEDEPTLARTLVRLLNTLVHIDIAPTVAHAKEVFAASKWVGVIVDVTLPDGNGLDVLEWARTRQAYDGPALVFSGRHESEEINRAFDLDAQYLVKPAGAEAIRSFVVKALARASIGASIQLWTTRYKLSRAESAILKSAADGRTRDEIAAERRTSVLTTKTQINTLLAKTGDRSLLAAVGRLLREQL